MKDLLTSYFIDNKMKILELAQKKEIEEARSRTGLMGDMLFMMNNFIAHVISTFDYESNTQESFTILNRIDHTYLNIC